MCRCLTTSSSSVSPSRAPTRWSRRRGACCTSTDYGHPGLHGSALPHDGRGARGEVAQAGRGRREGRRHARRGGDGQGGHRSEEHTSELQSLTNLVCRLLLEKKKNTSHTVSNADVSSI